MKTLYLTLSKKPFEVMVTGEKQVEFRVPSKWIISRLGGKSYDRIRFTNGYGKDKPYFEARYIGWRLAFVDFVQQYSNGLVVEVKEGDVLIFFSEITERGNIKE